MTTPMADHPTSPHRLLQRWLLLLAVLPVAAWVVWESQRLVRADLASLIERQQLTAWANGDGKPPTPGQLAAAGAAIQQSLRLTPDSPALHEKQGDVHFVAARLDWARPDLRKDHLARAAAAYQAAATLRPSEPQTWVMLATAYQGMGRPPAEVHAAWAQGLALGPHEGHVQPMLLQVVLADWPGASPAMQAWAKTMFDNGDANTRRAINAMAAPYGLLFSPDPPAAR